MPVITLDAPRGNTVGFTILCCSRAHGLVPTEGGIGVVLRALIGTGHD
jgi:hypothetical protein